MRSYHYPSLDKSDVNKRLTSLITFILDPLEQLVVISYYSSAFNENIKDMYQSLIEEFNLKDQSDIPILSCRTDVGSSQYI